MAFLPDGTMFFTEKCHGLSVRQPGGTVVKLLGMKDAKGYASTAGDLFCEGQAGMAGVAVDPNFASNRFIYVYSTSSLTAPGTNRVLRLKVDDNTTTVSDRTDIVTDIPYKPRASNHPFGGPGAHNGGRVRFSPGDGFLYVTTGDTHNGEVPQSPTRIGGKVLRIDRDGKAAPGNGALSQGMFTATFLTGPQWKAWNGRMIIGFGGIGIHGTPVGNRLDVLDIKADGSSATRTTVSLPMPAARFRSLVLGPDGNLYVATDEGSISRLAPN